MKRAIDSQFSESPHSFSLLSEPPDITNWFPSYKYESFVLDTYDGLGGSQFGEGETERSGSLLDGEMNSQKERFSKDSEGKALINDKFESQISDKMLDSLYSASVLSEPPQIKNWFPSYEYQSPMSDEDLKVSDTQESDSDKDESPYQSRKEENCEELSNSSKKIEEGEVEEIFPDKPLLKNLSGEVIYKKPYCKISDSSEFSELSEPPAVGNWFSSYVYESPDENSELVIGETEYEDDQSACQGIKKEKEMEFQKLGQRRTAGKKVTDLKVPSDNNLENEWEGNQDIVRQQREHCLDDTSTNHGTNLTEKKQTLNIPPKAGFAPFKNEGKLSSRLSKAPSKLIYELNENIEPNLQNEHGFTSSANNAKLIDVAAAATRQATRESNKENREQGLIDGFVATKKSRTLRSNNENSFDRNAKIQLKCSNNRMTSSEGYADKNGAVRRKVPSKRTDFDEIAAAMEVTGKWKCPQKGKPMIRPPLKQLRLEQWVRRHH